MAPTILIFSIAMDADYSFEFISIAHWVPQFFMHNKSILGDCLKSKSEAKLQVDFIKLPAIERSLKKFETYIEWMEFERGQEMWHRWAS